MMIVGFQRVYLKTYCLAQSMPLPPHLPGSNNSSDNHNAFCGHDETKNVKGTANRIVWISISDNFQHIFFRQSLPKVLRQDEHIQLFLSIHSKRPMLPHPTDCNVEKMCPHVASTYHTYFQHCYGGRGVGWVTCNVPHTIFTFVSTLLARIV